MAYQPPNLQSLLVLAVELKQNYSGQNLQRTSFISLLNHIIDQSEHMPSDQRSKLMLGIYMFELERIENEYRLLSPERSSAYRLIKQRLNFTDENILTEEQRLIYLAEFYNHVRTYLTPDAAKQLNWTKDNLLDEIKGSIKSLLSKQTETVQDLLQSPPEAPILKKNLIAVEEQYRQKHDVRWFASPKRLILIEFVKFMNDSADQMYANQDEGNMNINRSQMVRLGAVVYGMMNIEKEYYWRSAENSELYNLYKEATNFVNFANLSPDKKIMWLTELSAHIQRLLLRENQHRIQEAKDEGFREVEAYLRKVQDRLASDIAQLTKERNLPPGMLGRAGNAASLGVSYGSTHVASRYIVPSVGGMMVDASAGVVGTAVFGPAGGLVAVPLSRFVRDKIIPDAMANAFAMVLERIGYALGRQAVGVVAVPFVATGAGLRQLLGLYNEFYPHDKDAIENKEWINALMSLPDDIFDERSKELVSRTRVSIFDRPRIATAGGSSANSSNRLELRPT